MNTQLIKSWNLDFSQRIKRRANTRRFMRSQLRCHPKGKGNKAWRRLESDRRQPGVLIWPDYTY